MAELIPFVDVRVCVCVCSNLRFFVDQHCHPQSIAVVQTRAEFLGVEVDVGDFRQCELSSGKYCGILVQYPNTHGRIEDHSELIADAKAARVGL